MALPIIVCGQTEQIGTGVVTGLKPEIEGMDLTEIAPIVVLVAEADLVNSRLLSPRLW
jgi:hypothetical protein